MHAIFTLVSLPVLPVGDGLGVLDHSGNGSSFDQVVCLLVVEDSLAVG